MEYTLDPGTNDPPFTQGGAPAAAVTSKSHSPKSKAPDSQLPLNADSQ